MFLCILQIDEANFILRSSGCHSTRRVVGWWPLGMPPAEIEAGVRSRGPLWAESRTNVPIYPSDRWSEFHCQNLLMWLFKENRRPGGHWKWSQRTFFYCFGESLSFRYNKIVVYLSNTGDTEGLKASNLIDSTGLLSTRLWATTQLDRVETLPTLRGLEYQEELAGPECTVSVCVCEDYT